MPFLIIAAALALATAPRSTPSRSPGPAACFVAEVAVLWDDVPDYRIDRVVVVGIRKVEVATDSTPPNCASHAAGVLDAMRRALDGRLGTVHRERPQVRTNIEVRNASVEQVNAEISRIASRAREHAGSFERVELVPLAGGQAAPGADLPLPRLSKNAADAASCAADNDRLVRTGAGYRWAC